MQLSYCLVNLLYDAPQVGCCTLERAGPSAVGEAPIHACLVVMLVQQVDGARHHSARRNR